MPDTPSDAAIRAWARLERAHRAAVATIEARLKAARLPGLDWYDVLLELERADGGLRPFALQKELLFEQYNLSRLIDRMAAAGYVLRHTSDEDGRGRILAITRVGRAMRRKIWSVYAAAIEDAVGRHFSAAEAATLATLLGRLHGAAP